MQNFNENKYSQEYKDYSKYVALMISTDQLIFSGKSAVRARMIEYGKSYKELHIIIFSSKRLKPEKISPNCTIYSTSSIIRWNYVSDARKIGKGIIKKVENNMPILITCQDPFETALAGKCLVNLKKNSELLIQIHTDLYSPYFTRHSFLNRIRLFISKFTLPHAQVYRVVSNKIADSLVKKGIPTNEIIVKPISVNTEYIKNTKPAFVLKERYSKFKKIVLMVSRLESEKNVEMALDAWQTVAKEFDQAGLVIVGSGKELSRLKKQAYRLKIDSKVVFEGWQTDTVPYYKGSDIFLNTSWYEGYGMVFKEAEAAGSKIVSTDVGIAREVGAHIVQWNKESIAQKLIELLK